jgi:hypothetical protein
MSGIELDPSNVVVHCRMITLIIADPAESTGLISIAMAACLVLDGVVNAYAC